MANKKITDLPTLTNLSDDDWFYVVDVSDLTESGEGTSKKVKQLNTDNTKLAILNNLSDLDNASVARTNLGLGTLATQSGTFADKYDASNPSGFQTISEVESRVVDHISNIPYDATGWDGYLEDAPSMNSVRDKFVLVDAAISWTKTVNDIANNNSGNVGVGTGATAPSSKLTVFGDVDFKTSGGVSRFYFNPNGQFTAVSAVITPQLSSPGTGTNIVFDSSSIHYYLFDFLPPSGFTTARNGITILESFNLTNGSARFNHLNFSPTINQTGSSTSIIGGIYINPTLTSAVDFRAIEVTAGKVIIPNGTASNEAINKGQLDSASGIAGSFSATGTATTTFTVTIGATQANTLYKVVASPSNALSAVMFYINNKTTTTFDVVFVTGLTGAVAFDWILKP